ncbi:hypothetical protein N8541_02010, partial [Akkermansiaceae bacterium]|nr:hypothetical protein [Akkermansiaceae bacterium]
MSNQISEIGPLFLLLDHWNWYHLFLMKVHGFYLLMLVFSSLVCRADLVGHWTFDEASGTTAGDSSANNRNGT